MKLTIERKELLTALNVVKSAAAINGGYRRLPILSNVLINTFDKSVEFTCTDLDLVLRAKADADIDTKGTITVPVQLLHDLVRGFKAESLTLEMVKDDKLKVLRVKSGDSDYKLGTLPVEEFPPAPRLRDAYEIFVPQFILRSLLTATAFAASTDMTHYILNGSLLRVNGNLTVAATNGRKLAVSSTDELEKSSRKDRDLIVPSAAIAVLFRLLDDNEESNKKCRITTAENLVQFQIGDTVLTSNLIEGTYPDYQRIIPAAKGRGVALDRAELLEALQRCALISEVCRFEFKKQTLTLHSLNRHQVVGEALETLLVSAPDTPRATLNVTHLIEALRALDDDEIQFHASSAECPVLLKTADKPWLAVFAQYPVEEKATPPLAAKANGNPNGHPTKAPGRGSAETKVNGKESETNGRTVTPAAPMATSQRQTTVAAKPVNGHTAK